MTSTSHFVESFPVSAMPGTPVRTAGMRETALHASGLTHADDDAFRNAYGISLLDCRHHVLLAFHRAWESGNPSTKTDGLAASSPERLETIQRSESMRLWILTLASLIPLRRWRELYAGENAAHRDLLPPVLLNAGSHELARTFVWSCAILRAREEGGDEIPGEDRGIDYTLKAHSMVILGCLFDLHRFPLRAAGAASASVLLEELHYANARKVALLRDLSKYKGVGSQTLWLRRKEQAPWWAVRALEHRHKDDLLVSWLALGGPKEKDDES